MIQILKSIVSGRILFILLLVYGPAQAQSYDKLGLSLNAQLALVEDWLVGNHDNHEQVRQQSSKAFGAPVYTPLIRMHMLFEKADMPSLGKTVFYARVHRNDNSDDLIDQGLLVAEIDREAQGVRLSLYRPKTLSKTIASVTDLPASAARWQRTDTACDILLRYKASQMVGKTHSPACRASAIADPKNRTGHLTTEMALSDGSFWMRETVRKTQDGPSVFAHPATGSGYVQLRRADWYDCIVLHNPDGNMEESEELTRVTLHSQGGAAPIDWPDGRKLILSIHSREFWTPTKNRNLMLRVMEDGNPVPLVYSYSRMPTDGMGLNTGWFYTRCAISTQTVF